MPWFKSRSKDSGSAAQHPGPAAQDAETLPGEERISAVVLEGADAGASLLVSPPQVEIGRGDETAARAGRLSLRDRSVSNLQARLSFGNDGWWLEHNPAATNPTLLNGAPVVRERVRSGDRLRLGRVTLELRSRSVRPAAREERTEMISAEAIATTQLRVGPAPWGHLRIVQGPAKLSGTRFPLLADSVTLGRAQDCDLVLLDPGVSRRHAEIVREADQVFLLHCSETNPTLHNGAPVGARTALAHGDEIGLADAVLLRLELARRADPASAPRGGGLRQAMEERVDLEQRIEREFVRDGTFLDVDVADSYGLKAGEPRAERVFVSFERFRGYLGERIAQHRGRVLNSNGDEIMAFFERAADAVSCARAMQAGLRGWNARENLLGREFRIRIGVHTGRSAVDLASGVAYSPVLDVAGHLQKNAPIGGVLLSETTHAELGGAVEGLEPGAPLARESLSTWVLAPERLQPS